MNELSAQVMVMILDTIEHTPTTELSKYLIDLNLKNQIKTYTVKNINKEPIQYHYLKITGKSRYLFYQNVGFNIQRKQERLMTWAQKIGSGKYGGKMTDDKKVKKDDNVVFVGGKPFMKS